MLAPPRPSPMPVVAAQQRAAARPRARRSRARARPPGASPRRSDGAISSSACRSQSSGSPSLGERAERADFVDQRVDFGIAIERADGCHGASKSRHCEQLPRRGARRSAADLRGRSPRAGAGPGARPRPARRAPARTSDRRRSRRIRRPRPRPRPRTSDRRAPRPGARAEGRRRTNGSCRCAPPRAWPSAPESRARSPAESRGIAARALDLGAQPQLEFAGRLLGEGHRDDPVKLGAPAAPAPRRSG